MSLSRDFLNETRDGVARQPATHFLYEGSAFFHRDLKVSGSGDTVQLMEIVRQDAEVDQRCRQIALRLNRVIDTSQQDSLVEHSQWRGDEPAESLGTVRDKFRRVVGMDDHDCLQTALAEPAKKIVGNSVWQDDRQASVDSEPPQMRDRFKSVEQIAKPLVRQHERIATAEQHFLDRRVGGDRIECRLPVIQPSRFLAVRIVPPEPVATVDGAGARRDQQCPCRVLLEQSWGEPEAGVINRVELEAWNLKRFFKERHHLAEQRIVWIGRLDPLQKTLGNHQRKQPRRLASSWSKGLGKAKPIEEFVRVADRSRQGSVPICGSGAGLGLNQFFAHGSLNSGRIRPRVRDLPPFDDVLLSRLDQGRQTQRTVKLTAQLIHQLKPITAQSESDRFFHAEY